MKHQLLNLGLSLMILAFPCISSAQIILTGAGSTTENFDSLTTATPWSDDSTLPGWYAQRTGNGTDLALGTGTSTGGDLYSVGSTTVATDRALGSLGSGNAAAGHFAWGVQFLNNSGGTLALNTLSYHGEQWRKSGGTTPQIVTFWYQIRSTPITSLTPNDPTDWTPWTDLDFASPVNTATGSAVDGNDAGRVALSDHLGLTLPDGHYVLFRWNDPDHSGTDHLMAIDDFSLSYAPIPEPSPNALLALTLLGCSLLHRFRPKTANRRPSN